MTTAALVTKDSLNRMLIEAEPARRANIIGRALVAIYARQTKDEQASNHTAEDNGIGFAGCDAHSGSLTAKSYIKNQSLLDWQTEQWMRPFRGYPRICKYSKQLNQIALEKQQQKIAQQSTIVLHHQPTNPATLIGANQFQLAIY